MVFDTDEIITWGSDGIFGVTRGDWENSKEYKVATEYAEKSMFNPEATIESDFINAKEDKFAVYQIKDDLEMRRNYRFEGLDYLKERGWEVNRNNYVLVYTAPLTPSDTLDSIYGQLNLIKPQDFPGHSPSVSDVIVLHKNGEITSHYVDRFGFSELPAFLGVEKQADIDYNAIPPLPIPEPPPPEPLKSEIPIYPYSAEIALQNNEIDAFHASRKLNVECGEAIDQAVTDNN
jgi:hypothetical protein